MNPIKRAHIFKMLLQTVMYLHLAEEIRLKVGGRRVQRVRLFLATASFPHAGARSLLRIGFSRLLITILILKLEKVTRSLLG